MPTDEEAQQSERQIEDLKQRLQVVEDRLKKESEGPLLKRFKNLGIIVGCVGGLLGGGATAVNIIQAFYTRPALSVVTGGPLEMVFDPEPGRIKFKYGLTFNNSGNAVGNVTNSYTTLALPSSEDTELTSDFRLEGIAFSEKNVSLDLPFAVPINQPREVRLVGEVSKGPHDSVSQILTARGLVRLVLHVTGPNVDYKVPYCFYFTNGSSDQLQREHWVRITESDPRCLQMTKSREEP